MAQGHLQAEGEEMEVMGFPHLTVSLTSVRQVQPSDQALEVMLVHSTPWQHTALSFTAGSCSFGCLLACTCSHLRNAAVLPAPSSVRVRAGSVGRMRVSASPSP